MKDYNKKNTYLSYEENLDLDLEYSKLKLELLANQIKNKRGIKISFKNAIINSYLY